MRSPARRSSGGGFTGHPAIIFWLMTDFGKPDQSIQGNLMILDKWLNQLEACTQFKKDLDESFRNDLTTLDDRLLQLWEIYDPMMEAAGFSPNEKYLITNMREVYRYLALMTARAHVCDGISFDQPGDDVE